MGALLSNSLVSIINDDAMNVLTKIPDGTLSKSSLITQTLSPNESSRLLQIRRKRRVEVYQDYTCYSTRIPIKPLSHQYLHLIHLKMGYVLTFIFKVPQTQQYQGFAGFLIFRNYRWRIFTNISVGYLQTSGEGYLQPVSQQAWWPEMQQ